MTPEEAVVAFRPYAWKKAGQMLGPGEDREDATQEAMIAVYDAAKRLDPAATGRQVVHFLNLVARQRIAKFARTLYARRAHEILVDDFFTGWDEETADGLPGVTTAAVADAIRRDSEGTDPAAEPALRADVTRAVRAAVAALPEPQRRAVEAVDLGGKTAVAHAREEGVHESAISLRRKAAHAALRASLAEVAA